MRSWRRRIPAVLASLLALGPTGASEQRAALSVQVYYEPHPPGPTVIAIAGTGISAVANNDGRAIIHVMPGTYDIMVRRLGFHVCLMPRVQVPPGGIGVTIYCGASGFLEGNIESEATEDVVRVTGASAVPFIGLFDLGTVSGGTPQCANDELVTGTGTLTMSGNARRSAAGVPCRLTALLLGADRAPFYESTSANVPWTAGLGDVYDVTTTASKLRVPIKLFVLDTDMNATRRQDLITAISTTHLALAQQVLDNSYAGLELAKALTGGPPDIEDLVSTSGNAHQALLAGGCLNAARIRLTPAIYDPGRLNVYYVNPAIGEDGGERAGYSCGTSDAPDIIFIDSDGHRDLTLAHEIGHSLGLTLPDWGHSDFYAGFYGTDADPSEPLNVMTDGQVSVSVDNYLSVGQVAWMHLNPVSWLNRSFAGALSSRAQQIVGPPFTTACSCPESGTTDHCPALATDLDRTPLKKTTALPTATYNAGCSVKLINPAPTAPTVTMCASGTAPMEATAHAVNGTAAKGSGKLWVSLAPDVVTASLIATGGPPYNVMKGTLTGVSPGTAVVRAYYGGVYATIKVTVNAC